MMLCLLALPVYRIRSEFAAASLKPEIAGEYLSKGSRIRSEFAAASLKLGISAMPPDTVDPYPQRIRCGLIEADFATPAYPDPLDVSAANSLRPH